MNLLFLTDSDGLRRAILKGGDSERGMVGILHEISKLSLVITIAKSG